VGMVALRRWIGSAFVVTWGDYGQVSQFARKHGISRQYVYREARQVAAVLDGTPTRQELECLRSEVVALRQQVAQLNERLALAVVLDDEKQTEFACAGQGCGVTLPQCQMLLEVLLPGQALSVASLGRRTQAAGEKSGALLEVFDEFARPLVRDATVRDIFRRAYRASSLVECINSVLRMHQAQHRKLTQGMLNLKRLYWNCHRFRTGRRRGTTPYQRLGVPWPEGLRWWDVLKLTPEQLRERLSTTKNAA
jgi:hypothetical protein